MENGALCGGKFRAIHTPVVLTRENLRDAGEAHACRRVLIF